MRPMRNNYDLVEAFWDAIVFFGRLMVFTWVFMLGLLLSVGVYAFATHLPMLVAAPLVIMLVCAAVLDRMWF